MKKTYVTAAALLATALAACPAWAQKQAAQQQAKPRVFVNPGHGGHDRNDRYEPFYNYGLNERTDYYESDSNFAEGESLAELLRERGYEVFTSRVTNTTADDLPLFEISQLALNSGADVFFSIHSNDTGTSRRVNFPLSLYRGYDNRPAVPGSDELADIVGRNLDTNQATATTRDHMVKGDWSFYDWGYGVGLGVLRFNKIPGMLIETSFHDYIPERERFLNKDYTWLNAYLHTRSFDEFFGRTDNTGVGVVAGVVRFDQSRKGKATTFGNDALQPASDYPVELCDPDGNVLASYTTDQLNNGFYCFAQLQPGTYVVAVDGAPSQQVQVRAGRVSYANMLIAIDENGYIGDENEVAE